MTNVVTCRAALQEEVGRVQRIRDHLIRAQAPLVIVEHVERALLELEEALASHDKAVRAWLS